MFKRTCIALLFVVTAATLLVAAEHTYTVRKGDTLWGISERFVNDHGYWPNLWAKNPYIRNPHLIYPGNEITLSGEPPVPSTRVTIPQGGTPAVDPGPEEPPQVTDTRQFRVASDTGSFISDDKLEGAGKVIATTDERIFMATNDEVFIQFTTGAEPVPGDLFALYDVGREVIHPVTGARMGYHVSLLGQVRVQAVQEGLVTARVNSSRMEIMRGARALPWREPVREVALRRSQERIDSVLVDADEAKIILGQFDVIYIDKGTAEGIAPGNLLYISRKRTAEGVSLPDELLGAAVVFSCEEHTASALIFKSAREMYRGDTVFTVTAEL